MPWQWSVEEYGRKLKIGGGKERMASLFSEPAFLKAWPAAPAGRGRRARTRWPPGTSERPKSTRRSSAPAASRPRSGVKRISEEALANGLDSGGGFHLGSGSGERRAAPCHG